MLTEQELNMIQAREKRFDYVEVSAAKKEAFNFITMKSARESAGKWLKKAKDIARRKKK